MSTLEQVKELRNRTNIGLNECRSALDEAGGDVDAAIEVLQKRGVLKAAARASRIAADGQVYSYIHTGGKLAVLVEINCETDFAAKSEPFLKFCELVSMQIAALGAKWLSESDIPLEELDHQRHIFISQVPGMTDEKLTSFLTNGSDSPEFMKTIKILDGKVKKWFTEVCLMNQESVTTPGRTIEQLRTELVASIGENITIRRFVRWEVGEGIAKNAPINYASEVHELAGVGKLEKPKTGPMNLIVK